MNWQPLVNYSYDLMEDGALPERSDMTLEAPLITIFFTQTQSSVLWAAAAASLGRAS